MRNRFVRSIIRGTGCSQVRFTAKTNIAVDMNMLDRQLESTRINWLRQQNNVAQNISFTHHHHQPAAGYDHMPELAAMFEKSSGELDTFTWHSNPQTGDLASFADVPDPGTESRPERVAEDSGPWLNLCSSESIDRQVAVKESAAMNVNEVVVSDNESDDDWFFINDFETFADELDSSGKRKAEFSLAEDYNNEERTKVEAMESIGCKRSSSKNAADTSKASESENKLGKVRGRPICHSQRDPKFLSSAEKKRRQKIHDKLQCLRNMIPWSNKHNKSKTYLLDEIIIYLKYLENQFLYFQLLLAEPNSQDNPPPVIKPKKFTAKKKSPTAAKVNFANPAQQARANFIAETERQLAFASQVAAQWGSSTYDLSLPAEQYVHGPYSAQELPITYDPQTLSLLHQSFYH